MNRIAAAAVVACATALAPAVAEAHLVVTGMGPVFDGATHVLLSPEDILPATALGCFAGLRGPRAARLSLASLTLTWFVAGVFAGVSGLAPPALWLSISTVASLLACGGVLAADVDLSPGICASAAAALGLLRGLTDFSGWQGGNYVLNALGTAVAAAVLFALVASLTLPLRRQWTLIAARVVGSWIAAVGLLLAGWITRYGAGAA